MHAKCIAPDRNHNVKNSPVMHKNDPSTVRNDSCECFYCHECGHIVASCPVLKCKNDRKFNTSKNVALVCRQELSVSDH